MVVVQSQSDVRFFATPWTAAHQASLSLTVFRVCSNLSKFAPVSWGCHPTISFSVIPFSCLQSFPASGSFPISQLFASGDQSIGASASASVLPMISFRIDMFDCLAVQGTLKGLLQHHNSKVSILWCSAFFVVWLAHLYMTTGKTVALTRQTFVGKVMSLLFIDVFAIYLTWYQI